MRVGTRIILSAAVAVTAAAATFAQAQEVTGKLGSPSATTTISGKQLPAPEPKFGGVIKDDALNSTPWWAPAHRAPRGGPQRPAHHHR